MIVRAGAATRKHEPKRDFLLTLPGGGSSEAASRCGSRFRRMLDRRAGHDIARRAARPLGPSRGMRPGVPSGRRPETYFDETERSACVH